MGMKSFTRQFRYSALWLAAFTGASVAEPPPHQWALPKCLREASGLDVISEHMLLAHNDEKGKIYRLNLETETVAQVAAIGKPTVRDDFEGIAADGSRVFLITSKGMLYIIEEPAVLSQQRLRNTSSTPGACQPAPAATVKSKACITRLASSALQDRADTRRQRSPDCLAYELISGRLSTLIKIPKPAIPGIKNSI